MYVPTDSMYVHTYIHICAFSRPHCNKVPVSNTNTKSRRQEETLTQHRLLNRRFMFNKLPRYLNRMYDKTFTCDLH